MKKTKRQGKKKLSSRAASRRSAQRNVRARGSKKKAPRQRRPKGLPASPEEQQARTIKAKTAFLKEFGKRGIVVHACQAAKVGRRTFYSWLENDEAFRELHAEALEEANDAFEAEAARRAVDGVREPVFQGGELVGHVQRYSDSLLQTMLKARRPIVFRERLEHTGKNGGPIQTQSLAVPIDGLTDEELAVAEKLALLATSTQPTAQGTHG